MAHSPAEAFPSAPDHSLQPVPDSSPIDASADETSTRLTPHHLWLCFSENHWRHWHGIWVLWQPLQSREVQKIYKSVRSFTAVDGPDRKHVFQRNQWYAAAGDGGDVSWAFGPWDMYEHAHSLEDGIVHPNNGDARFFLFPNGDLCWLQLAHKLADPKYAVLGEVHFMLPSKDARVAVVVTYNTEGTLGVCQLLEESMESENRPDESWNGTLWQHHRSELEESRPEPEGKFVGKEFILTPSLDLTTRTAEWRGFKGGLGETTPSDHMYTLMHLPYLFTCCVPKQSPVGKDHSILVNWVVSEDVVRMIGWRYGKDGKLQYMKTGLYERI